MLQIHEIECSSKCGKKNHLNEHLTYIVTFSMFVFLVLFLESKTNLQHSSFCQNVQ